eukprot:403366005
MSIGQKIKSWIRTIDMYGAPLTLRYKSNEKYKTILGGGVTLLSRILILSFFIYSLLDVYEQKNNIVKKTLFKDKFTDNTRLKIDLDNFDVGLTFQLFGDLSFSAEIYENPLRFYDIQWIYLQIQYDKNGLFIPSFDFKKTVKCNETRFGGDKQIIESMGVLSYLCPENIEYDLYGSQTGANSQYFVQITPCDNSTLVDSHYSCADPGQLKQVFDATIVQVLVMTDYFDAFEINHSPIKKEYKTLFYSLSYETGSIEQSNVLVGSLKPGIVPQLALYFMQSPYEDVTTRTVKSFMDCLSLAGGLSSNL